ncbi:hypothetical protein SLS57_010198 [Botryosphaeria dothidea]|uniref:Antibiotic biosynthesis monooxygenase protein n=1 Tax=Botryosphaeria dothidea TaxID=55169 RepID=A0A8H4J8Z2_9PEZI|nr:putative antibiotic biosynthesis monooxygenase protein [Botryosphaeria dothidea]
MSEINVIAVVTPKPGQKAVTLEGFSRIAADVEKNEPGCLIHRIHETEEGELVVFQRFKDKAAAEAHRKADYVQKAIEASKAAGDLAQEPYFKVFSGNSVAGFGPR